MVFPKDVIDKDAYVKYVELYEELENDENKIFQTSNPNLKINLTGVVYIIKKQIINLPQEEQDEILKQASIYRGKVITIGHAKTKAFGNLKVKTDDDGNPDFSAKQAEILDLFGRFYTIPEVHKICITQWQSPISQNQLRIFFDNNRNMIDELRKEYEQDYADVRLGKRRSRLDEMSWIYSKTKDKYNLYEAREDAKLMLQILEQIKRECDGDIVINGKIQVDIEQTINLQIQQEMIKEFNITAFIIAKMAGRLNINPMFLISRLSHSHYAKFTGFTSATKEEMTEGDIYSPTGIVYDWNAIVQSNANLEIEDKKLQELPTITESVVVEDKTGLNLNLEQEIPKKEIKAKTILEIMLEKVKAKQAGFDKIESDKFPVKRDNIGKE
jgi:hypothetical protein